MAKKIILILVSISTGFLLNCSSDLDTGGLGPESLFGLTGISLNSGLPAMISSIAPARNSAGISTTPAIRVQFSKNMSASTINDTTFTLMDGNGTAITGTVAYDGVSRIATFSPPALANSQTYTITLSTIIADDTGSRLPFTVTSRFTTVDSTTVPSPEFSLMAGSYYYSSTPSMSITCSDGAATIMYTTDGSTPTQTNGTAYTAAFAINKTTTVKAVAYRAGLSDSSITVARYTVLLDPPAFTIASGTYNVDQDVWLTTTISGATIHYTTNGTVPTAASPVFTAAITITGNGTTMTIRAITVLPGMPNSAVASNTYTIDYDQVATPSVDFPGGNYNTDPLDLHIWTTTANATIYYSVDGGAGFIPGPSGTSEVYITLTGGMTMPVTVVAYAVGNMMETSAALTETYIIDTLMPSCSVTTPVDNSDYVSIVPPSPTITVSCTETMDLSTVNSDIMHPNSCTGSVQVSADGFTTCAGLVRNTAVNSSSITFSPTFRLDGRTRYQVRLSNTIADLAGNTIGADITTSGFTTDMDGTLDTAFNTLGYNVQTAAGTQVGSAVKIQSDGRIVVAGFTDNPSYNFAVWRYDVLGVFDGTAWATPAFSGNTDQGTGIALTPSHVIVTGLTQVGASYDIGLAGHDYSGNLDPAFGGAGTGFCSLDFLSLNGYDYGYSVAADAVGRIVVAGCHQELPPTYSTMNFAVARFIPDGSALDAPNFGPTGMLSYDFNGLHYNDVAYAVAIDPGSLPSATIDDRIIVAGSHQNGAYNDMAFLVYDDSGNLLMSRLNNFGYGYAVASAVAVQPDGAIILAGYIISSKVFAVSRYSYTGGLDTAFAPGGVRVINIPGSTSSEACAIALQPDGKILVAGTADIGSQNNIVLVRLNQNGSLDTTFARSAIDGDDDGIAIFNTGSSCIAKGMAIQADGRVVITGHQTTPTNDVLVVRFK